MNNNDLITQYIDDAKCRDLTSRTIENYKSCLRIFSDYVNKPLMEIDIDDLKTFKAHLIKKGWSTSTISRYFTAIQSFFEYLEFEEMLEKNLMPKFRKRYLTSISTKRYSDGGSKRKLASIEEMTLYVNSIIDPRDKAVVVVLIKTGIRRNELINIDVEDIDWADQCIHLKPTPKRSNLDVFFDDECARVLKRWMVSREHRTNNGTKALFINERGGRLNRNGIYELVTGYAVKVGLHNPTSKKIQEKFTPHCFRHFYTTNLRRNGMPREFIKELRGDSRNEAIDIYHHIDRKELKDSYFACIPKFGID